MNFQPIGQSEQSDCRRYFITKSFTRADCWDSWHVKSNGPNEQIGKHLPSKEAARECCVTHHTSKISGAK